MLFFFFFICKTHLFFMLTFQNVLSITFCEIHLSIFTFPNSQFSPILLLLKRGITDIGAAAKMLVEELNSNAKEAKSRQVFLLATSSYLILIAKISFLERI